MKFFLRIFCISVLTAGFSGLVFSTEKVGITAGDFRINEQGAATYSVPLVLPSGSAGVTPEISLNYSSQGGDGILGIGWSLSAGGAITRCPKTLAQDNIVSNITFTNADPFCLNGQRLVLKSGTHGRNGATYHTEVESFSKITAYGNATSAGPLGFTVDTKSGDVHYYGYVNAITGENAVLLSNKTGGQELGEDAFIEPEGKATKSVAKIYYLKAIKDVSGNYILFEYLESAGNTNLERVSYGGNSKISQIPYAYVETSYLNKVNQAKKAGYVNGTAFLSDKFLNKITIKLQGVETRHYQLGYDVPAYSEDNYMLQSIQECVLNDCYPATVFDWERPVSASQSEQEFCEYEPGSPEFCWNQTVTTGFNPFGNKSGKLRDAPNQYTSRSFDMNGDGYSDIVYVESNYWKVAFGPTFSTTRTLTNIGQANSEYLLTIDYNGDGRRDLLVANSATSTWNIVSFEDWVKQVQICEPGPGGGGGPGPIPWRGMICHYENVPKDLKVASIGKTATGYNGKSQVLDINGDGLEDIVFQNGSYLKWYKNNGGTFANAATLVSFTNSNSGALLNGSIEKHTANMKNAAGVDVNGDGRSDLILKVTDTVSSCMLNGQSVPAGSQAECQNDINGTWSSSSSTGWKLYTSTGTSLVKKQDLGNYEDVRVADINGDGLTDLLQYSSSSVWSYRLSNGQGFLASKSISGSTTDTYKDNSYFIDLNMDGAADFLKAVSNTSWTVFLSEYKNSEEIKYVSRGSLIKESGAVVQFGDVDGDGKLDMLQGKSGTHGWRVSYAPKSGKPEFVIKQITNGFGAKTYINYRPMTDTNVYIFGNSDDNRDTTTFSPMSGMPLVSRVQSDSGGQTLVEVQYQYGGFLIHRQGRGMLGFEQVRTIDSSTGIETETIYDQDWPYVGMPLRTKQFTSSQIDLSDASNVLASRTTANGGVFPYIQSSSEYSYSIGTDSIQYELNRTNSSFTYDSYGNLDESIVTISDHFGNDDLTTAVNNIYGSSVWEKEKGRLTKSTVSKTRDYITQIRSTDFSYYGRYDYNSPGMLKSTTAWTGTNKQLITAYEYDNFGNKVKVTKTGAENSNGGNIQNRESISSYSTNGRLLDFSIDATGVRTDFKYNGTNASSVNGLMLNSTSTTNGLSHTKVFNTFGQIVSESSPGVASVYSYREFCSVVSCGNSGAYYRTRTSQTGIPEKHTYFDFLGREIESRVKNFSGGWTRIFKTYDSKGRADRVYEPTNSTSGVYFSQFYYDLYDREIQIKQANGAITKTEYYGLRIESLDPKNYRSKTWKNVQGEVQKTQDVRGNKLEYSYDARGNLLSVKATNSVGAYTNPVINTYDSYGFKTQTNDKDKGIWKYYYNAFGELVQQTTARGHHSYLDYDKAGRLIRRYENDGTSCWNYSSSNGRLINEKHFKNVNKSLSQCVSDSTANQQKDYFYDDKGRAEQTNVVIRSVNSNVNGIYSTTSSFDTYGRVSSVTYPNGLSVTNVYQNGYLDKIKNTNTGKIYQNINSMNAYGQVVSVNYANGASESIGYASQDGKVSSHQLLVNGTTKHLLNYAYDNNNNLNYRAHRFYDKGYTHWKENLTFDNLNRLDYRNVTVYDSSYLTGEFTSDQNYNYDDWGNLTYKHGVGNYYYDSSRKNRLLNTSGTKSYSMSYDGNGNITNDGDGRSFTYFTFDKVNRITDGSQYSEFLYASNRSRYYKHDRRTENALSTDYYTAYIGAYEKIHRTGGGKAALTEHKINLGNIVITERSDGSDEDHYMHKDHLGSAISVTDGNGSVVQQFTYDPWGKQTKIYQLSNFANLIYNQPCNQGYTGHEHIRDLNIVHMNGRIYDANIGRFMQSDPNIQSPGNLQNYNRYSYVLNNPLSLTDPSGFFFKSLFKFVKKYWRTIAAIVISVYLPGAGGLLEGWGISNVVAQGAITGFIAGGVSTGSLRGALVGALSGAMFGSLHDVKSYAIVKHGIAGGISSVLSGGKFGHGFFSAGFTKAMGNAGIFKDNPVGKERLGNALKAAVIGGTVSQVTGGKFSNGAVTGAFSRMLNDDAAANRAQDKGKTYSERAKIYRKMQAQVDAAGIDTVWFGVAADLNEHFARTALFLPGMVNDLGVELLGHNTETFNQIMNGEITQTGMALDNFLVVREQMYVQNYIISNYGLDGPPGLLNGYVNASFIGDGMLQPNILSNGVSYVVARHGSFNFWDTYHRIELGQAMMSQRRHGVE